MLVIVDQYLLHGISNACADRVHMPCKIRIICLLVVSGPQEVSHSEDQEQDQDDSAG
jgi:hypothetical protein